MCVTDLAIGAAMLQKERTCLLYLRFGCLASSSIKQTGLMPFFCFQSIFVVTRKICEARSCAVVHPPAKKALNSYMDLKLAQNQQGSGSERIKYTQRVQFYTHWAVVFGRWAGQQRRSPRYLGDAMVTLETPWLPW